jgi:hypothetical protein
VNWLGAARKWASALFLVKEANPMLQRMEAVVLFYSPSDLGPGTAALVEHGFEVEVLDYIDDYGPAIWIKAKVASELDVHRFSDWVQSIVEPLHGDVEEAGLSDPSPQAA